MNADLNIKVLRAIYTLNTAGSVTKAAELLQVTPAAVTYLINQARKITGSALFYRTRDGMKPNTLALELCQRYQNIMRDYYPAETVSSSKNRVFIISTYSLFEFYLAITLGRMAHKNAALSFVSIKDSDTQRLADLRNKQIDIDIGERLPVDSSIVQIKLFSTAVGVMTRKDHPSIGDKFNIGDWHSNNHVVWSKGMPFISDDVGHTRQFHNLFNQQKTEWRSSDLLSLTLLCAHSDMVSRMPMCIGNKLESVLPIKIHTLPEELSMTCECYLHYHHSFTNDLIFQEFINNIKNSF